MKVKQLLLPAFTVAVGLSFVAAEVKAAQENMSFTGRVRGWYESKSTKAGKYTNPNVAKGVKKETADTISDTQFKADSRLGVQASMTKGAWTGKAKLELDTGTSEKFAKRDMWVQVGNKSFDVKLGRIYFGDACVTASYPVGSAGSDCVGDALGRNEGVQAFIKGLPVGLNLSYMDINDKADDKSGYRGALDIKAMNATVVLQYTTVSAAEKKDRSNDRKKDGKADGAVDTKIPESVLDDGKSSSTAPSIMVTVPVGKMTFSGGYEMTTGSKTTTSSAGDKKISKNYAKTKKVDTGKTELIVAGNLAFGDDMSVGAFYNNTKTTTDEKVTDALTSKEHELGDETTNTLTIGFKKQFPGPKLTVGYHNSSTSADKLAKNDGAKETRFTVGMQYGF